MMFIKTSMLMGLLLFAGLVVFASFKRVPVHAEQPPTHQELAKATFAGGCFWCMQPPFEKLDGVVSTTVGYTGGHTKNPSYGQVSAGGTGHAESVQIVYDPTKISYEQLLDIFW